MHIDKLTVRISRCGSIVRDDTTVKGVSYLHVVQWQATTTAKARIEQDRLRRAKKRDDQLHDVGKGRFKETLSLLERRRAAERERVKGNESFKVRGVFLAQFTLMSVHPGG